MLWATYMKSEASKQALAIIQLAIIQLNPSSGVKMGVAVSPWVNCRRISRPIVRLSFATRMGPAYCQHM